MIKPKLETVANQTRIHSVLQMLQLIIKTISNHTYRQL